MKIRPSIILFVAVIVFLTILIIWFGKKSQQTPETNATEQGVAKSSQSSIPPVQTNAPATKVTTNANVPKLFTQDKGEQIREGLATLNDVPIIFYGRLQDQFGNPVVGAEITGSTIIYNGTESGGKRVSTVSDDNGFFHLDAGKGESLGVMPRKQGYALATTGTFFHYSYMYADHFTPDKNNPTVIKMWKLQGAKPLVDIGKEYKLQFTNAPIFFDLVAGKIVPSGGDIKIIVNRPEGEVSEHNPQKWSIDVEVVDGGFIETSDKEWSVTYAAPESGYQSSDTFGNNNGIGGIDKTFFVQSRNGRVYSKLGMTLLINAKEGDLVYIRFGGVANTNSSRNWEATAPY